MIFETERIYIRTPKISDIDYLYDIRNSDFVLKYNAMELLTKEQLYNRLLEETKSENIFNLELKDTSEVIGTIYFSEDSVRYKVNSMAIEYFLNEKYTRCGYMTEALERMIDIYFNKKGIDIFTVRVFAENTASRRLVEKLGFKCEGYLKKCVMGYNGIIYDDTIYSLYKEIFKT